MKMNLSVKGVIVCENCNNLILKYDSDKLAYKNPGDQIKAVDFKSCVAGWPDPKETDEMRCPFCRTGYATTLRNMWKYERDRLTKKEWDE